MLKAHRGGEDIVPVKDQLHVPVAISPERADGTQWMEGPVGTRADTGKAAKRKISIPTRTRNSVISPYSVSPSILEGVLVLYNLKIVNTSTPMSGVISFSAIAANASYWYILL
jgi:hypothetical protein